MALLSAFTVIRGLSVFHITVAYFLLVSPQTIADQNVVFILGEAMQLPEVRDFAKPTEVTAYAALILFFLGTSDLVAASLPEVTSLEYWISQVPVRLLMLFGVTSYTYLFKDDGIFGSPSSSLSGLAGKVTGERGTGELVRNNLVFTTGFLETTLWFWVFVLLREERRALAGKLAERIHERQEIYGK